MAATVLRQMAAGQGVHVMSSNVLDRDNYSAAWLFRAFALLFPYGRGHLAADIFQDAVDFLPFKGNT